MAVSRSPQAVAERMDRETDRLRARAFREIAALGREQQSAAIRAFRGGGRTVAQALSSIEGDMLSLLTDGMVASHLRGRRRILIEARARKSRPIQAQGFDGVIQFLEERMRLSEDQLQQLRDMYQPHALGVIEPGTDSINEAAQRAIDRAASEGLAVDGGVAQVRRSIEDAGGGKSPHVYEAIFRTQIQLAYAAGQDNSLRDPAVDEILWGHRYVTVGDDRVRPSHVMLDGTRAPKNDPIWSHIRPPNGWNCRCSLVSVFRDDPRGERRTKRPPAEGEVDGKVVTPGPDAGFDFRAGDLFQDIITARSLEQ